jgi:ABC-type branched-subunit amino acid transport system permease subunit/ABC-type branched-subunit amino acid transport system ATPase component
MPAMLFAFTISREFLFRGVIEGMIYGLVAMGIVLVYKSSGVINFAQGQFGAASTLLMLVLTIKYDFSYWLAFPIALITGAALGGITELLVVRRLFKQPRLLLFIATLGVSQVILFLMFQLPETNSNEPVGSPISGRWHVWGVNVRGDQIMVLIVVPIVAIALTYLLQRTRFGQQVRAAADNPNAASLAGISVKAVSTQVWVIAGLLSAVSTVLISPIQQRNAGGMRSDLGPELLLTALTAAMVGRLTSFPMAMAGGLALGIIEVTIRLNSETAGLPQLLEFVLLLVLVLARGRSSGGDEQSWSLAGKSRVASADLARLPIVKWTSRIAMVAVLFGAAMVPLVVDNNTDRNKFAVVLLTLIIALSATLLTGWAGQLSLGQIAFMGVGAVATSYYSRSLPYPVAIAIGTAWGAGIAVIIGVPALRVRGLYLAMITLGFQIMATAWLFPQSRLSTARTPGSINLRRPYIFGWDMKNDKTAYYYVCLGAALIVMFIVSRVRASGIGRSLIAVRDNELSASAFTVSPTRAKLIAFGLSGGIAAFAGGLYLASVRQSMEANNYFPATESLRIVAIAVVGGVMSVFGAVLGTFVIVWLPTAFDGSSEVKLFTSGLGMLILLMYFPGGLISIAHNLRDLFLGWVARRTGIKPKEQKARAAVSSLSAGTARHNVDASATPLLATDVTVRFFGRAAVSSVSITVYSGEVVGLIGTNGAGKSTFMNAVSGFVPCTGAIEVFGRRVEHLSAHRRARMGMGRAFQNARLFGALTVRETIMTALESRSRSLLVPSMLFVPPSPTQESRKRREAGEIIDYLGLGRYADTNLSELSTGTRRIVELASLIALDAKLLLLDEPTAGVAQKETEAFGPLIKAVQIELGASILLIEHDMPLVMSISDRIYCLEAGMVIAEGAPSIVRENPLVIASYLGTDTRAINRSDIAGPAAHVPEVSPAT